MTDEIQPMSEKETVHKAMAGLVKASVHLDAIDGHEDDAGAVDGIIARLEETLRESHNADATQSAAEHLSDMTGRPVEDFTPDDDAEYPPLDELESVPPKKDLAVLAHRLWTYWSRHIADEELLTDSRIERWESLWVPFEELSEGEKGTDYDLVSRFYPGYADEKPEYNHTVDTNTRATTVNAGGGQFGDNAPSEHISVRRAIRDHRNGLRPPVRLADRVQ